MATWEDGSEYAPTQVPLGFATPVAPALSQLGVEPQSATVATIDAPEQPPTDFTAPTDRGPALDQIAPAPPEQRDPHEAFSPRSGESGGPKEFDPHKPLIEISTEPDTAAPNYLPPVGNPVTSLPAPTGVPVAAAPPRYPQQVAPQPGPHQAGVPTIGQFVHQPPAGAPLPYQQPAQLPAGMRPNPYQNPNYALGPQGYPNPHMALLQEANELQWQRQQFATGSLWDRIRLAVKGVNWGCLVALCVGFILPALTPIMVPLAYLLAGQARLAQPTLTNVFRGGFVVVFGLWLIGILTQYGGYYGYTYEDFYTVYRVICFALFAGAIALGFRDLAKK